MSFKKRKRSQERSVLNPDRLLRLAGLLILVAIFALGGLGLNLSNSSTANQNVTPTLGLGSPTPFTFPTVEQGGTVIVADRTYFHPSALFSLLHFVGFDLAPSGEERVDPAQGGGKLSRAGSTFIHGVLLSVVHAFVEKDDSRPLTAPGDQVKYFDTASMDAAWANFTGGLKETGRRMEGDRYIVDDLLYLNGNTYLGRQISQVNNGWVMVTRLVVPDNNPGLLETLTKKVWEGFVLYPASLDTPISWSSTADLVLGYVIKYPSDWRNIAGGMGQPAMVTGTTNGNTVTLTTKGEPGVAIKADQEARAWVTALRPKSVVLTVKPETHGDTSGFLISYNDPDPDGNARSALAMLLNGANGTLYSVNFLVSVRNLDLAANPDLLPDISKVRGTFTILPTSNFVPTLTPTTTYTPSPTVPVTATAAASTTGTPGS